ncbi:MAG: SdrD B-like domain-containing protein, partial [Candidatus Neomarinimicrobiota bacterium]
WNDLNQDGIQDQGEPGLEDVMVRLKQNGVEIARKRTDANGYYEFTGLCAGDYQVFVNAVTLPKGINWVWTLVEQGSDRSVDSNSHPADVTLTDGQIDHTIDFGFYEHIVILDCFLAIEKYTNGFDADNPVDAPKLLPGNTVTWTYEVTNTGTPSVDPAIHKDNIVVTDNMGVVPILDVSTDVGSDQLLSPGETWVYEASGIVQDLQGGTYANVGSVDAFVVSETNNISYCQASDPSHYVNEECGNCVSQFTQMEFEFLGTTAARVVVTQNKGTNPIVFDADVQPGEHFTIYGSWAQHTPMTLGTEIEIKVDGTVNAVMHTSCSDPDIVPGYQEGLVLIINIKDKGGWVCAGPE